VSPDEVIDNLEKIFFLYLGCGVIFAVYFVHKILVVLEPKNKKESFGFKATIFPGLILFWPLVLPKTLLSEPSREKRQTSSNHFLKGQAPMFFFIAVLSASALIFAVQSREIFKTSNLPTQFKNK